MKQLLVELSSFDYVSCIVDSETRKVQSSQQNGTRSRFRLYGSSFVG